MLRLASTRGPAIRRRTPHAPCPAEREAHQSFDPLGVEHADPALGGLLAQRARVAVLPTLGRAYPPAARVGRRWRGPRRRGPAAPVIAPRSVGQAFTEVRGAVGGVSTAGASAVASGCGRPVSRIASTSDFPFVLSLRAIDDPGDRSSLVLGVGHAPRAAPCRLGLIGPSPAPPPAFGRSVTVGVGHRDEEDPLSEVGSADVSGADPGALHRVTEEHEPTDNGVQTPPYKSGHVLDDDDAGSQIVDDSEVFPPQSGAVASKSSTLARKADVLTWEPATKDVWTLGGGCRDRFDMLVSPCFRPVCGEHVATEPIGLGLPDHATEARPFEAELKAADPREQRPDRDHGLTGP